MADEIKAGCTRPSGGPSALADSDVSINESEKIKETTNMIQVGKKAPDFTAAGYHKGGFINVTLNEYLGKWVVLCFYPGDFTFV